MDVCRLGSLINFFSIPSKKEDFTEWVSQKDVVDFLVSDVNDDDIILHASAKTTLLNTVLVLKNELSKSDPHQMASWDYNNSGWSVCSGGGRDKSWVEPPLESCKPNVLSKGEPLIFKRSFHGVRGRESYIEVSEKFLQVMDLHYMHELNSWCKLDKNGDIDEIIKIHELEKEGEEYGTVVSIRFSVLAEYCYLTETAVVRLFDVDRIDYANFTRWGSSPEEVVAEQGVFGKRKVISNASYFRGVQAFAPIHEDKEDDTSEEQQYATFIAQDWKNKRVEEISCAPSAIDNYFTDSDKAFELSPAFFNAEVILKYKSDTDKYTLEERSITSRAGWYLKSYDINEAGQIHTYLGDLQKLPYSEQLHWKQYNEKPKAPISERSLETDFKGNWFKICNPVEDLKRKLDELDSKGTTWWKMKNRVVKQSLHSVYSKSVDEWKEEILRLDQVLVEGLVKKQLKAKAKTLGQNPPDKDRELKLVEWCLLGCGFDAEHARSVLTPWHDAHNLRSVLKGHISGQTAEQIRLDAIKDFGSLRNHFNDLCERCHESLCVIFNALEEHQQDKAGTQNI